MKRFLKRVFGTTPTHKKNDNTRRDDIARAICIYTGDGVAKVLPWVKDYLKGDK